jgi:hypothetical protein
VRMLDLFCGRFGWSKAFAARGWECVGVDLIEPPEIPQGCRFVKMDILEINSGGGGLWNGEPWSNLFTFDFICASSPCEQFSVHGMKHFHPNPPYPELGIRLFEHTRAICEASGVPYVMENVRAAQQFVGNAKHHCGPFYLWGSGVPPLMNQGILKGARLAGGKIFADTPLEERRRIRANYPRESKRDMPDSEFAAAIATIPPELANCVCDYAERLLEQKELTR